MDSLWWCSFDLLIFWHNLTCHGFIVFYLLKTITWCCFNVIYHTESCIWGKSSANWVYNQTLLWLFSLKQTIEFVCVIKNQSLISLLEFSFSKTSWWVPRSSWKWQQSGKKQLKLGWKEYRCKGQIVTWIQTGVTFQQWLTRVILLFTQETTSDLWFLFHILTMKSSESSWKCPRRSLGCREMALLYCHVIPSSWSTWCHS